MQQAGCCFGGVGPPAEKACFFSYLDPTLKVLPTSALDLMRFSALPFRQEVAVQIALVLMP
jgi:hypothetical protein